MLILCFFVSANVFAQGIDSVQKDTSKRTSIVDARPIDKSVKPLVVVDGQIYTRSLERINPEDILEVSILKGTEAGKIYGSKGINGVVIITTKRYATIQYEKKFSAFSKEYKHYVDSLKSDDQQVTYVINGEFVAGKNRNDETSQLYNIPEEKIEGVVFKENPWYNGLPSKKYLLIIASKK